MAAKSKANDRDDIDDVMNVIDVLNDDEIVTSNDSYDMIKDSDVLKIDVKTKIVNSDACIEGQREETVVASSSGKGTKAIKTGNEVLIESDTDTGSDQEVFDNNVLLSSVIQYKRSEKKLEGSRGLLHG
jgi:hypothetical protein